MEAKDHVYQLSGDEKSLIDQKVEYEIVKSHFNMINLGGLTNIISGIIIIWILYTKVSSSILFSWYAILVVINLLNMAWAYKHRDSIVDLSDLKQWRKVFCFIFALICLSWGTMTIIFSPTDLSYHFYLLAFLLAVLIGFTFSSITDFLLAIISISCLLIPSIIFYLYSGIGNSHEGLDARYLYIGIGTSLFILGIFLFFVSMFGAKLVKRFFQLSFTNVALSHKLENINKYLEERVKERTLELQQSLQQVTYQATHDLLTQLPNQRTLIQYVKSAIKLARKNEQLFAIVFFSLNEIDRIYNALGYQAGDHIMKVVAHRFREAYGEPKVENIENANYLVTLARNDIFVILVRPIANINEVEDKIKDLFRIVEKTIYSENQVLKLTASIGVSLYPRNGRDITSLLMNADAAMLLTKQVGGNSYEMYKSEINAAITKQLELETHLHTALLHSEFILQYQPLIDLKTTSIVGAEALVRWENPTLGRIPPDSFIPLAEANGIILPLGEWVFRTACRQANFWHKEGFPNLKIAINMSAKQFQHQSIIDLIANITEEIDIDPTLIELELTETTAFRTDVIPILEKLKALGFLLSIDDFGTGYSGLKNIQLFTVNILKIDKAFVQGVESSSDSRAIVANTIALAKNLNIVVAAEGIETKGQLDFLMAHGCDLGQGYYFSQPVGPEIFTELLKAGI